MGERIRFYDTGQHIRAYAVDLNLERTFSKYEYGKLINPEELAIRMHAYFCHYGDKFYAEKDQFKSEADRAMKMTIDLNKSQNSIGIAPPFPFERRTTSSSLVPPVPAVVMAVKQHDEYVINRCGNTESIKYLEDNVYKETYWKAEGRPWDIPQSVEWNDVAQQYYAADRFNDNPVTGELGCPKTIRSLKDMCLSKVNSHDKVYGGNKYGSNTVPSTANIDKNLRIVAKKYDRDTVHTRRDMLFAHNIAKGMEFLDHAMDVVKDYGKLTFECRPKDIINMDVSHTSSSGIRAPDPDIPKVAEDPNTGVKYKTTANGSKGVQEIRIKYHVIKLLHEAKRTRQLKFVLKACSIVLKHEIYNVTSEDLEERLKMYQKGRDFFIGHLASVIFARLVQGGRQRFERGWVIQVGINLLFGGAASFKERMGHATNGNMKFFDGDFSGLDTGMQREFLELYATGAVKYQASTDPEFLFFLMLLRQSTENLSVKMVNVYSNVWRIMIGCMPSGFYETSHGNSWAVALWFYMYVHDVTIKCPTRKSKIEEYLKSYLIGILTYGDDHIGYCPEDMHDIINEKGFKEYVSSFGMIIRDARDNLGFTSKQQSCGEVDGKGIIFLQKYFVETYANWRLKAALEGWDIDPFMPFKSFKKALHKLVIGNNWKKTPLQCMLAAIAAIYDNAGANHEIHWLATTIFYNCYRSSGYTCTDDFRRDVLSVADIGEDVNRAIRKAGISLETLLTGLPNEDALIKLHKIDEQRVNFKPQTQAYRPGEDFERNDYSKYKVNRSFIDASNFYPTGKGKD